MRVDACGRSYYEVPVFPTGRLKTAFETLDAQECCECLALIHHGTDRYFQRNESTDGLETRVAGVLMALTYDAVCGPCGDRFLNETATR